jgi:maleate isomerase
MYGWRARIGLLIPSANTTMEPEFNRMAPEGVSIHTARLKLSGFSPEALIAMGKEVKEAARMILDTGPEVIVFGCTSGSFVKGVGHDQELVKEIEAATGRPATATSQAVLEALQHLKIQNVAVVTPYPDNINQKEKEFLEGNGIRVVGIKGAEYRTRAPFPPLAKIPVSWIGLHEPYVAYKLALEVYREEADGIFISCTNFRTIEIIELLEKAIGKPVVTSNQATMVAALRKAGIQDRIKGYGTLMETM